MSGTCRDFAWLMIESVRRMGFAARFATGYLYSPGADHPRRRRDPRLVRGLPARHRLDRIRSHQRPGRIPQPDPRRRDPDLGRSPPHGRDHLRQCVEPAPCRRGCRPDRAHVAGLGADHGRLKQAESLATAGAYAALGAERFRLPGGSHGRATDLAGPSAPVPGDLPGGALHGDRAAAATCTSTCCTRRPTTASA